MANDWAWFQEDSHAHHWNYRTKDGRILSWASVRWYKATNCWIASVWDRGRWLRLGSTRTIEQAFAMAEAALVEAELHR